MADYVGILRVHGDPDRQPCKPYDTEPSMYDPEKRSMIAAQLPEILARAGWAVSEGLKDRWGLRKADEPKAVYMVDGDPLVTTPYIDSATDVINLPVQIIREEARKTVNQYVETLRSKPKNTAVGADTETRTLALILPEALAKAGWRMTQSQRDELGIGELAAIRPGALYTVNNAYIPTTKYPMPAVA